ncbi:hypothetical protein CANARDRAFT_21999 [[Candida] arabinofermentans NRRL YB-2248]|uniref:Uncharacterized protein n=1 Tax=[Candida] arabinofermentans NRRL YB-2248 TaxID=983967 RepID=A0A1E4T5L4_9ASCO|nr:hypothetical protein CANARDRAFT_21999 [[Candida] arabinofermentans NRRL YB-2248]
MIRVIRTRRYTTLNTSIVPITQDWTNLQQRLRKAKVKLKGTNYNSHNLNEFNLNVSDMIQYDLDLYTKTPEIKQSWSEKVKLRLKSKTNDDNVQLIPNNVGGVCWYDAICGFGNNDFTYPEFGDTIEQQLSTLQNLLYQSNDNLPDFQTLYNEKLLSYAKYHKPNIRDDLETIEFFTQYISLTKITNFSKTINERMKIKRETSGDDDMEFENLLNSSNSLIKIKEIYDKTTIMKITSTNYESMMMKIVQLVSQDNDNANCIFQILIDSINNGLKLTELETEILINLKLKDPKIPKSNPNKILNYINDVKSGVSLTSSIYSNLIAKYITKSSSTSISNEYIMEITKQMNELKVKPNRDILFQILEIKSKQQDLKTVINLIYLILIEFKITIDTKAIESIIKSLINCNEYIFCIHLISKLVKLNNKTTDLYNPTITQLSVLDYLNRFSNVEFLRYSMRPSTVMFDDLISVYENGDNLQLLNALKGLKEDYK